MKQSTPSAEQALKLQAGVEHAANGIVITDLNGIIEFVNPAFCRMTGYSASEVVGKRSSILKSGQQSEAYYRELWTAISAGRTWHGRFHNRRKDGTLYWERAAISPIKDCSGSAIGYIAIKEDISEHVDLVHKLQVEQDKLVQARQEAERLAREAEAANIVKREFLANMSHELRTPLNAIVGVTHLLSEETDPSLLREYIQTVEQSSRDLLDLINDILDFSRIEANRLELDLCDVDLHELVNRSCNALQHLARGKRLAFTVSLDPRTPRYIVSDELRLRQILANLVSNAIKFTSKGGVAVRIFSQTSAEAKPTLVLEVQDTGIGISSANAAKLFRNFSQVDASTTRRFGGSGLGLAIVKGLTELFGGKAQVHSQEGVGSTFTVELPLVEGRSPRPSGSTLNATHTGPAPTLKVLVAEDNPTNRRIMELLLRRLGHECDFAFNGFEAVEAVQKKAFDIVLMDLQMPVMDGLEAAAAVRALGDKAHQPRIVALTARAMAEDRAQCEAAGMDDYLSKPININSLREVLLRLC
ncbi:MAG: ATP-binding protein [Verrucomicrobia bacterium]|nr:ATP-binding protein [Verrucomicrobiota bacterium]